MSTLSPNAFYVDLNISLLSVGFLSPSGVLSGFPTLAVSLTLCLSFIQQVAVGFNSHLQALIDSGSSHSFMSKIEDVESQHPYVSSHMSQCHNVTNR
jgi:hypothetical protein